VVCGSFLYVEGRNTRSEIQESVKELRGRIYETELILRKEMYRTQAIASNAVWSRSTTRRNIRPRPKRWIGLWRVLGRRKIVTRVRGYIDYLLFRLVMLISIAEKLFIRGRGRMGLQEIRFLAAGPPSGGRRGRLTPTIEGGFGRSP
jgi:hypothetical protein